MQIPRKMWCKGFDPPLPSVRGEHGNTPHPALTPACAESPTVTQGYPWYPHGCRHGDNPAHPNARSSSGVLAKLFTFLLGKLRVKKGVVPHKQLPNPVASGEGLDQTNQ